MTSQPQSFLASPESAYVGTLSQWDPVTKTSTHQYAMDSGHETYIGRDSRYCNYVIEDPYVSRRHVHIYTIIFDRDDPQVAPLVYAQDLSTNGTLWNGHPMGKNSGSFLLSDGDILQLVSGVSIRYSCRNNRNPYRLDAVQRAESRVFEHKYTITPRILGSGAYGKVHMAFRKETGEQLACKIIDLRVLKDKFVRETEEKRRSRFFKESPVTKSKVAVVLRPRNLREKLAVYDREAEILEGLSHPNIIGIEKVIKSKNTIYLFQDLITAGDLFSYLQYKGGRLPEIEAAVIVRQISMALDYLHDQNIAHRDLKPDNILMTSLADGCRVVLTDFGCARLVGPGMGRMSTVVGTFDYTAPEVFQKTSQGYTKAVDLWSLGCVTFVVLVGDIPFKDPLTRTSCVEVIRAKGLEQLEIDFQRNATGERAADFVRQLLVFDEAGRMDAKQALSHGWFNNRAHKADFDALYMRSVKRWVPRVRNENLIVRLRDLINQSPNPCEAQESQSQLPDDSIGQRDFVTSHAFESTTLSDPVLPPHNRAGNTNSSQSFSCEGMTSQPDDSSILAQNESSRRSSLSSEAKQCGGFDDRQDDTQPQNTSSGYLRDWNTEEDKFIALVDRPDPSVQNQDDDEVYETRNPIIGKKQRAVYGSDDCRPQKRQNMRKF